MIEAVFAYLHYLAMMCLLAALAGEHLLLGGDLGPSRMRQLVTTDVIHGGSVALALLTGIMRLGYFGKGTVFYTGNPLFHVKMGLFAVLAVLALYQAIQFQRLRAASRTGGQAPPSSQVIGRLKMVIRVELTLVVLIPILAVLMGRGFGY